MMCAGGLVPASRLRSRFADREKLAKIKRNYRNASALVFFVGDGGERGVVAAQDCQMRHPAGKAIAIAGSADGEAIAAAGIEHAQRRFE